MSFICLVDGRAQHITHSLLSSLTFIYYTIAHSSSSGNARKVHRTHIHEHTTHTKKKQREKPAV